MLKLYLKVSGKYVEKQREAMQATRLHLQQQFCNVFKKGTEVQTQFKFENLIHMYTLLHMCFSVMSCRVPIGVPNVKEMDSQKGCFWLKVIVINRCKEQEKCE